jgi:hypothetical protein
VVDAVTKLNIVTSKYSKHEINIEKVHGPGLIRYDIYLPCGIKLNFFSTLLIENCQNPLSHILHNFDMDICQVAFKGSYPSLYGEKQRRLQS